MISLIPSNTSNQTLAHLHVHGEAVHPEQEDNLKDRRCMAGQEPGGGQLDMVGGGEGGGAVMMT